ncbi:MAG: hypothetical protein QF819_07320 [Gemmatimonadota bacterium]|nr:hypothetical protein [Gemmatimonadota bacterium]MDP6802970.1 hypothetical protein [Gemmatimonadota bacterium]MDP7032712.1 hypothetical protein [Gemmatimonadota bacterium]
MRRIEWACVIALAMQLPADAGEPPYDLVANPDGLPVVHLGAAAIDSIGSGISDRNMVLAGRIEEAYQSGRYGTPGHRKSRKNALAALLYNAESTFSLVCAMALQSDAIYTTSEADLHEAFSARFRNPGTYPVLNLKEARTGAGAFLFRFDLSRPEVREITIGGLRMGGWTEDVLLDGRDVRAAMVEMHTFSHEKVVVVYEEVSGGSILQFEVMEDGIPVLVSVVEDIRGQYVRKFGLHTASAMVIWSSVANGIDPPPEGRRLIGSAMYFPELKVKLPWFLPDIGFGDLRRFDFPDPLLTRAAVNDLRERAYDWLEFTGPMRFANWDGEGDIPAAIISRYPDW